MAAALLSDRLIKLLDKVIDWIIYVWLRLGFGWALILLKIRMRVKSIYEKQMR